MGFCIFNSPVKLAMPQSDVGERDARPITFLLLLPPLLGGRRRWPEKLTIFVALTDPRLNADPTPTYGRSGRDFEGSG